jgi:hypothetical protein
MRTRILGLGVVAIAIIAGPAFAGEFERNPDRFPSLGFTLNLTGSSGDNTVTSGGLSQSQDVSSGLVALEVDARVPVSPSVTLSGAVALVGSGGEADENAVFAGQEINEGGISLTLGMRYYFNQ